MILIRILDYGTSSISETWNTYLFEICLGTQL